MKKILLSSILFVYGFFVAILCSVILPMIYNILLFYLFGKDNAKEYLYNGKEILLVVTSAIGTPLGFIIGYYFKEGKK